MRAVAYLEQHNQNRKTNQMSKVSFNKPGLPVDATEPVAASETQTQAEATVPCDEQGNPVCSAVSAPQSAFPFNEDNIGFADIKFPKIKLVQKSSSLAVSFSLGEIVLKDQIAIYTPPVVKDGQLVKAGSAPLTLVVIGFRKDRYVEKVAYGSDEQGILAHSLQEVARANGTLNFKEHREKKAAGLPSREFQTLSTALFLVRKPDDVKDEDRIFFPFLCEGQQWALVTLDMKGGLFTEGASVIRQDKKAGHLAANGYTSFTYTCGTKLRTYSTGNTAYVTVLKPGTKTSEELRSFIKQITGS
jgi:hypothetical protein